MMVKKPNQNPATFKKWRDPTPEYHSSNANASLTRFYVYSSCPGDCLSWCSRTSHRLSVDTCLLWDTPLKCSTVRPHARQRSTVDTGQAGTIFYKPLLSDRNKAERPKAGARQTVVLCFSLTSHCRATQRGADCSRTRAFSVHGCATKATTAQHSACCYAG